MIEALFLRLERRDTLADFERKVLTDSVVEVRNYGPRDIVVRASDRRRESFVLLEGYLSQYKDLKDGQRQILAIHVPGDFVDLHGFLLKEMDHNTVALTSVKVAVLRHERLREITSSWPHLSRLLWFSTLIDASIYRQWILSVGRRSAIMRLAHLFCELSTRLEVVGLADEGRFSLPLTQMDLAEATGLTGVHVNRMIRVMREKELIEFRHGVMVIRDRRRLANLAEFDAGYLYLDKRPR